MPVEPPELRTILIRHIHSQPLVAHTGIRKIKALLSRKYHWNGLTIDVARYVANYSYSRQKAKRDKTPGFLHPLLIPARLYQHLIIDFTKLLLDKHGYNFAIVIIDRLSKKPVLILYNDIITAKGIAIFFLVY